MSLIKGYKAGKAISVIIAESSVTSTDGRQAAAMLRRLGGIAVPKIFEALRITSRSQVLEQVLSELLSNETLSYFTEAITDNHPRVIAALVSVLGGSTSYDPNKLLPLIENPEVQNKALGEILLSQKDRVDIKKLLSIIDKVPSNTRPIIYRLLDVAVNSEHVPSIVAKSQTNEPLIRAYLATLLSRFDTNQAKNTLTRMLGDPNKAVRQAALTGLARLGAEDSVELICQSLSDPDMTVQSTAIEALCSINAPETIKYLIDVLQDESEYVRRAAVEVLNEIGDQRAIKDLLNALRDADWWVKVRAADALGSIGGPKVFEAVLMLIKDSDEFMRRTAVEILNTSKDINAFDRLVEALQDEDWWVRERAADALAGLGDQRAVKPLLKMLEKSPEASQVVLRALTTIGDANAIEPILKLLKIQNKNTQKDALNALKNLTDATHREDVEDAVTQLLTSPYKEIGVLAQETVQALFKRFGAGSAKQESKDILDKAALNVGEISIEESSQLDLPPSNNGNIEILDARKLKPGDIYAERYRVVRHVGKGAFGIVVLVEDTVVHDQYILKILNPHVASDEYNIKRFTQELRFARKVTHENIIRIYDFIKNKTSYAISMEYFPSHSLRWELNNNENVDHQRMIHIMSEICEGMSAAQNVGVVHRDLKPGNILINNENVVKIVDFGLAAAAGRGDTRLTKTGLLVGTPTYMSPEQVRGKQIDPRTDIYSLGVIMYETFTGNAPFKGDDSMSVMFQHVEGKIVAPREINNEISFELEQIILKAMALNPDNRYQNFVDMKANLLALKKETA